MKRFIVFIIGWIIILSMLFLSTSCVHKIERQNTPSCCQSLYDVLYLTQKSKMPLNINTLLDCCRKQQKYEFCNDASDTDGCIRLMKSF